MILVYSYVQYLFVSGVPEDREAHCGPLHPRHWAKCVIKHEPVLHHFRYWWPNGHRRIVTSRWKIGPYSNHSGFKLFGASSNHHLVRWCKALILNPSEPAYWSTVPAVPSSNVSTTAIGRVGIVDVKHIVNIGLSGTDGIIISGIDCSSVSCISIGPVSSVLAT